MVNRVKLFEDQGKCVTMLLYQVKLRGARHKIERRARLAASIDDSMAAINLIPLLRDSNFLKVNGERVGDKNQERGSVQFGSV